MILAFAFLSVCLFYRAYPTANMFFIVTICDAQRRYGQDLCIFELKSDEKQTFVAQPRIRFILCAERFRSALDCFSGIS